MTSEVTGEGRGRRQAIALIAPATLAVMASAALAPALPLLLRAFADVPGAVWLVPMVVTLPAVFMIMTSPLAGWLGDRFGRRRPLIAGLVFYAIFGLAAMLLDNLYALLIDRALVGVAEGIAMTLSTTLLADTFAGPERDRWLGFQTAGAALSAILFIAVGGLLAGFSWRMSFAIYAMPLLFALFVALWTLEPPPLANHADAKNGFPWRAMMLIWPVSLFGGVLFYTVQLQTGVGLDALGFGDPRLIGFVLAGATIATVSGSLVFRRLVGWPSLALLGLSFAMIGGGFVGMGSSTGLAPFVIALVAAQFGAGLLLPTAMTWAIHRLPYTFRGRGTGTWQGIFAFGQFLSPLIVTSLGRGMRAGHQGVLTAFSILGVAALIAALAAIALIAPAWIGPRKSFSDPGD